MSSKINSIDQLRLSLNILSREDVLKIHTATLDVIESIGVRFPSHKALDILKSSEYYQKNKVKLNELKKQYRGENPEKRR